MPTPQPPSLIWNNQVDPPVQIDASYQFDKNDRQYIDSQIRGLETKVVAGVAGNITGLTGDVSATGPGNASATAVSLSGSSGATSLKSNLVPDADGTRSIGSTAARLLGVYAESFVVLHAAGDTALSAGLGDGLVSFGPGGSTSPDTRLIRTAANVLTLDNAAGGMGYLALGGGAAGAIPAQSGAIRIPAGTGAIGARNRTNNGDDIILGIDGSDNTYLLAPTGSAVQLKVGGLNVVASLGQAAGDYVALGASPAQSGLVRVPNATTAFAARTANGLADIKLVATDSSNEVTFGDSTNASNTIFASGGGLYWNIAGSNYIGLTTATMAVYVPVLEWGPGVINPTLVQITPTSDLATNQLNIQAQNAYAAATTHTNGGSIVLQGGAPATTNGTPGGVAINLAAPTGSGSEAGLVVQRGGTGVAQIGPQSSSYTGLWFGASNLGGGNTFAFLGKNDGTSIQFNGPLNTSTIYFGFGNVANSAWNSFGLTLFDGTTSINGGGTGVLGIANTTVAPTSWPGSASGLVLYSTSGALGLDASGIVWPSFISGPSITQNAPTSDVAVTAMKIQAQGAFSTATTNKNGADLQLEGGAGASSGTVGYVDLHNAPTTTTAPGAGGAGALPATPKGYVSIKVGGTVQQVAYY